MWQVIYAIYPFHICKKETDFAIPIFRYRRQSLLGRPDGNGQDHDRGRSGEMRSMQDLLAERTLQWEINIVIFSFMLRHKIVILKGLLF